MTEVPPRHQDAPTPKGRPLHGRHPGRRDLEVVAFSKDSDGAGGVWAHVEGCATCSDVIARLREARARFLIAHPSEKFVGKITARTGKDGPLWRFAAVRELRFAIPAAAAVVIAVVLGLLYAPAEEPHSQQEGGAFDNRITLKGEGEGGLTLFVSRNGAPAVPHEKNEPLRENDVVKFGIRSRATGWVTIANLDEKGRATVYISASDKARITSGDAALELLEDTVVLDDFVGDELIVAFVSKTPLADADVEKALEKAYADAGGVLARIRTVDLAATPLFYLIKKTN